MRLRNIKPLDPLKEDCKYHTCYRINQAITDWKSLFGYNSLDKLTASNKYNNPEVTVSTYEGGSIHFTWAHDAEVIDFPSQNEIVFFDPEQSWTCGISRDFVVHMLKKRTKKILLAGTLPSILTEGLGGFYSIGESDIWSFLNTLWKGLPKPFTSPMIYAHKNGNTTVVWDNSKLEVLYHPITGIAFNIFLPKIEKGIHPDRLDFSVLSEYLKTHATEYILS